MAKAKVEKAEQECNDKNCPFHGELSTRGAVLEGKVVSTKMDKSLVVERNYYVKVRKYERYRPKTSRLIAHNPPCINAKKGEYVRIMECRSLSKNKKFVVVGRTENQN